MSLTKSTLKNSELSYLTPKDTLVRGGACPDPFSCRLREGSPHPFGAQAALPKLLVEIIGEATETPLQPSTSFFSLDNIVLQARAALLPTPWLATDPLACCYRPLACYHPLSCYLPLSLLPPLILLPPS